MRKIARDPFLSEANMTIQSRNGIDGSNGNLRFDFDPRSGTHQTAHELSIVALRQWEKALGGFLALPAAVAASTAAGVLHTAAFFERGFALVESSVVEIGRRLEQDAVTGESNVLRGRENESRVS